jgi:hypothetical protein
MNPNNNFPIINQYQYNQINNKFDYIEYGNIYIKSDELARLQMSKIKTINNIITFNDYINLTNIEQILYNYNPITQLYNKIERNIEISFEPILNNIPIIDDNFYHQLSNQEKKEYVPFHIITDNFINKIILWANVKILYDLLDIGFKNYN